MRTLLVVNVLGVMALCSVPAKAQHLGECATDKLHYKLLAEDSLYRKEFLSFEQQTENSSQRQAQSRSMLLTLPVVVHVIHAGERVDSGSNISDIQIINAIEAANDRFRGRIGIALDMEIEFCLAIRDPDCNPTTGIIRVDGSDIPDYITDGVKWDGSIGVDDKLVKDLSIWPWEDYINVWVVINIQGAAGYANYPSSTNNYQGIVMQHAYMTASGETFTHELGHYLNLRHTFDGDDDDTQCPKNDDCTSDGDRVCDTPPHRRGSCFSINPCASTATWDNSRYNYMSYCSNRNRFTADQKDRMRTAALNHAGRTGLLISPACIPVQSNCEPPQHLSESGNSEEMELTWSTDCASDGFNLSYREVGDSNWITENAVTPPHALSGLTCNADYEWRVQALCNASAGSYSAPRSFHVLCPCEEPENVTLVNNDGANPTFSWDSTQNASHYEFRVYRISTGLESTTSVPAPQHTFNTVCKQEYVIDVKAVCADGGESAFSDPYHFTSLPTPLEPAAISPNEGGQVYAYYHEFWKGDLVNSNGILFSWEWSPSDYQYLVEISATEEFDTIWFSDHVNVGDTLAVWGFPNDGSTFYWRIARENCEGWTFSPIYSFTNVQHPVSASSLESSMEIAIFPNPSNGLFQIKALSDNITDWKITVYDLPGKVIEQAERTGLKELHHRMQLPTGAPGIYFLEIKTPAQTNTKLLIVNY